MMRNDQLGGTIVAGRNNPYREPAPRLATFFTTSDPVFLTADDEDCNSNNRSTNNSSSSISNRRDSSASTMSSVPTSGEVSPCILSPWNHSASPGKSPWIYTPRDDDDVFAHNGLIGSISREEGHIYSLTASGDLLYTGSDSKNIRVWKHMRDYAGFKSRSGLVKAIVISGDHRIFTGHQDGKIRVWKVSRKNPRKHRRVGSLPTFKDVVKSSVNPKHYVEMRRGRGAVRVRHFDAVSCLSLVEKHGLLYSGSWDRTLKVWRINDSRCLESIEAHEDAINSVVAGFEDLVFTGSADGMVKAWRRETQANGRTKHFLERVLLKQENAVTALAISPNGGVIYCGSSDGLVNFWTFENHLAHGGALRGHRLAVLCLAAAGNLVFSGSADKNICIWRRQENGSHACLSVLTGHMGPVKCLAVEEDRDSGSKVEGDRRWIVYSGSLDKSVKVWRMSEHTPTLREMEPPVGHR